MYIHLTEILSFNFNAYLEIPPNPVASALVTTGPFHPSDSDTGVTKK